MNTNKNCNTCANCIAIGGGDYICSEIAKTPIMVIEDNVPTEKYNECNGDCWEE